MTLNNAAAKLFGCPVSGSTSSMPSYTSIDGTYGPRPDVALFVGEACPRLPSIAHCCMVLSRNSFSLLGSHESPPAPPAGGRARSGAERMSAGPTVPDGYGGTKEVYTSAHYFVDQSGYVWQGVDDKDSAQHAGGTVNNKSIGIEHTGFPVQLRDNAPTIWNDEIYRASARLGAYLVGSYGIPIVRITDPGGEGFIAHSDISTDRTDPGPNWDWDKYLALIKEYYDANDFAAKVDPSAPAVASASTDEEHDAEEDTG